MLVFPDMLVLNLFLCDFQKWLEVHNSVTKFKNFSDNEGIV